jgi:hypothetical protein
MQDRLQCRQLINRHKAALKKENLEQATASEIMGDLLPLILRRFFYWDITG